MTNEEFFKLIYELLERMEIAHKQASGLKVSKGDEHFDFVHVGDKEYMNPNIVPFELHYEIVQLCQFVKENPDLIEEELTSILKSNSAFKVLREVQAKIGNLIQEIKNAKDDEKQIPYTYGNIVLFEQKKLAEQENSKKRFGLFRRKAKKADDGIEV